MERLKKVLGILFIIITINIIPLLVNESNAQTPGITPIDPKNVTNQTLQGYPTDDKDMSTGLENK